MDERTEIIRILVVEDNPRWKKALASLYRNILGEREVVLDICDTASEATARLKGGNYHLLSLDILLKDSGGGDGDGLDVFETAARPMGTQNRMVNGVVIVTGAPFDTMLKKAIPEGRKLTIVQLKLDSYVRKWFPNRYALFQKHPDHKMKEVINSIRKELTPDILTTLAQPPKAYDFDDKSGTVTRALGGVVYAPNWNCYTLIKKLDELQRASTDPFISYARLYDELWPGKNKKEDLTKTFLNRWIQDSFRKNPENRRLKDDIIILKDRCISLRIP